MKRLNLLFLIVGPLVAQAPNPAQQASPAVSNPGQPVPIFQVTVVSRTTKAINYHHRTGTTRIDFRGTELMPTARGEAEVKSEMGSTKVETRLEKMSPASQYGPEYMTYVLWGITPEGRPVNLGEVVLEGDHAKLLSTTELQTFGLIVTAEPYYAVTKPSDVVVAENFVRKDTTGTIEQVDAKYELWQRGQYVLNRSAYKPPRVDPKGPLQLGQAENAVAIARADGAERYASDTFQKALVSLQNAEGFLNGKDRDRKRSESNAREAIQMAEDARIITFRKIQDEKIAADHAAAAAAQEQARLEQERRERAQAARRAAEQERLLAEQARSEAEKAAAVAAQERAAADAAKAAAIAQQQAAQADADRARADAERAENDKAALRQRLLQQLNIILETRETQRGLIVNISDVLFDFDKYTLKPVAREKLAKVAGILLAYPGLKIQLEGHTDSIGSDEYNQTLSEHRAGSVRDYLTAQGVPADTMTAIGLGKADPVASNSNDAGRQKNRRVEMVVSGEPIGIGNGLSSSNTTPPSRR